MCMHRQRPRTFAGAFSTVQPRTMFWTNVDVIIFPTMGAVKVQIFGQTYTIRGELDERYVQKLAAYVDEKMSAIADVTATVDTQKVAVLAALAIADELHTIRKDRNDQEDPLREQAERCLTLVERALKQTA
jgi:cell division protein ZapA